MGLISRPTKSGGNTEYVDEVAAGFDTILAAEVDADLDTIYGEFDGNITNANIAVGADIDGAKLAAGSVGTTQLANDSVTTDKILDGTIINRDISPTATIAGGKLAVGAAVNASSVNNGGVGPLAIGIGEATVVTCADLSTRGGLVLLFGALAWAAVATDVAPSGAGVIVRLYRDTTVILQLLHNVNFSLTGGGTITMPLPTPSWVDEPMAGTYIYKVTAQASNVGITCLVSAVPGAFSAIELR